ncbi:MAG: FlgD immunoglobulin-like domain containing protein [Candidatus Krumholzibacteria bacterium]|jgi:hypothetical protein|nr:FlgD immunoglobulin-like domain containing protein [Candidatus Krumholzibacteria bacterium]
MSNTRTIWSNVFVAAVMVISLGWVAGVLAQPGDWGCISPTSFPSRPIYMINPGPVGGCTDCAQDQDGGLVEFIDFLNTHAVYPPVQGIVGDAFSYCPESTPHGEVVADYFRGFGPDPAQVHMDESMAVLIADMIAAMTGIGAVGNLSVSEDWTANPERVEAFVQAYNSGLLLVGVPPAFGGVPQEHRIIGDKVLMLFKHHQAAPQLSPEQPNAVVNLAAVNFAAMWSDGEGRSTVADPQAALGAGQNDPAYDFYVSGYTDSGSFVTPLAAGSMTHIMAVAAARGLTGGALTAQTIDYIVSACDRPDDTFAVRTTNYLTSYGPWSYYWKYGFYNAWKALLYAYGFGIINCQDNALYGQYGVVNPEVAFSDEFELRGDLWVPAGQSLHVTSLGAVTVATATPEGPNYGNDASLHEIRIGGELTISGAVSASLVIDTGGSVTVAEGGMLVIAAGQTLTIAPGGSLQIDGAIVIEGDVVINGGQVLLNSDLVVSETGKLIAQAGSLIEAGAVDLGGGGADPAKVELNCAGFLAFAGTAGNPVVVRATAPGAGNWAGINLNSIHPLMSVVSYAEIADAAVGLDLAGSVGAYLQNNVFTGNVMGMRMTGRANDTLLACSMTGCGTGLALVDSSPLVDQCLFAEHSQGVHISGVSTPKFRNSTFFKNTCSVIVVDKYANPNLGTIAEPGNNQFLSPGKNYKHIGAFGVGNDIAAMSNWWGTTNDAVINSLIYIAPYPYQVQYLPKLMTPPLKAPAADEATVEIVRSGSEAPAATESAPVTFVSAAIARDGGRRADFAFRIQEAGHVTLTVHDLRGRRVEQLIDGYLPAGEHSVSWNGRDRAGQRAASGVYLVRLAGSHAVATQKVTLAR